MLLILLALIDSEEDKEKFTELYEKYENLLMWVALRRLGNEQLAEESVQDAWLYIASHFSKIDDVNSSRTKSYVSTVADSFAIDKLRKEKRISKLSAELTPDDEHLEVLENADSLAIQLAIEKIDPFERDLLRLYYFFGYKSKEIAEMLHMTDSTVRKRLQLARQSVKKALIESEADDD